MTKSWFNSKLSKHDYIMLGHVALAYLGVCLCFEIAAALCSCRNAIMNGCANVTTWPLQARV